MELINWNGVSVMEAPLCCLGYLVGDETRCGVLALTEEELKGQTWDAKSKEALDAKLEQVSEEHGTCL